jgi:hypothetical protein
VARLRSCWLRSLGNRPLISSFRDALAPRQ